MCMGVLLVLHICVPCVSGAFRAPKVESDPQELEFQMVVRYQVDGRNLQRVPSAFND